MELEELKNIWSQYDKKLSESLRLNEELLKKLNLDKSKREMNPTFNYEIVSALIAIILLLIVCSATIKFLGEIKFLISGIIAGLTTFIILIFSLHRLKLMSSIDFYSSPIIDLQKAIIKLKQKYFLYKKLELIIVPILAISLGFIVPKFIRNYDFFLHPYRFGIAIVIGLAIGYPLAIWIYKNIYEKRIENVNNFLEELKRFEKEG